MSLHLTNGDCVFKTEVKDKRRKNSIIGVHLKKIYTKSIYFLYD